MPIGLRAFRLRSERSRRTAKAAGIPTREADAVVMSRHELQRAEALLLLHHGLLSAAEAGTLIKLGRSQTYKLLKDFRLSGAAAVVRKARGRPSNRAFPAAVRRQVLKLIEENYHDYGPTLLAEVLLEEHGMKISRETIRQWMIAAGFWLKNRGARKRLHQPRRRMAGYGDLVQIDGSDHDWFEGRGPRCTLMVMVDDATGSIQNLKFFPRENRVAYYQSMASYIADHGSPLRVLTDKHSAVWKAEGPTEFTEALGQLNIVHSFAHSPQSKGRVERTHRTLQDRLVKSMRRAVIRNIEEANAHAAQYIKKHNRKFAGRAADDNHRRIPPENIDRAFAAQHIRKITKNHTFSFNGDEYLIENLPIEEEPVGSRILISIWLNGTMEVFSGARRLEVRRLPK